MMLPYTGSRAHTVLGSVKSAHQKSFKSRKKAKKYRRGASFATILTLHVMSPIRLNKELQQMRLQHITSPFGEAGRGQLHIAF